jgi:Uma2 family endonuclease
VPYTDAVPGIDDLFMVADDAGVRLEVVGGLPVWEASPNLTHQKAIDRIRAAFTRSEADGTTCQCLHYADLHIKFPDGSDKRPDIAVFCREPTETEAAVTDVPEAVIEILSKGYEKKDLELGPPFYLAQGVKDVVVFDPYTNVIKRFDADGERELHSPATLTLHCGCQVSV